MKICAIINTIGRYYSTLPLTIQGIINQTKLPNKLIIYDDNTNPCDLREIEIYKNLFLMLDKKGIKWEVIFSPHKGQVWSHQHALENCKEEMVWRVDDDEVPESNVLENLYNTITNDENIAAVGGLILDPKIPLQYSAIASSDIKNIYLGMNIQWFRQPSDEIIDVDHLYSSFLYKREVGLEIGGYNKNLSPVGHREETLLTFSMKSAGYRLLVNPKAVTWHYRQSTGGIRSYNGEKYYLQDEKVFSDFLFQKGLTDKLNVFRWIVLENGLGDHLCFKNSKVLEELYKRYQKDQFILSICYPEVFEDVATWERVKICSIEEAKMCLGDISPYNIYKWCIDHNWNQSMVEAYKGLYE